MKLAAVCFSEENYKNTRNALVHFESDINLVVVLDFQGNARFLGKKLVQKNQYAHKHLKTFVQWLIKKSAYNPWIGKFLKTQN